MKNFSKMIKNEAHFTSVLHDFSEAFVTGKFCDVKVVCKVKLHTAFPNIYLKLPFGGLSLDVHLMACITQDTSLWAHRLVLGSVSPFLRSLLVDFERRGDDVITIFLPLIKVVSLLNTWKMTDCTICYPGLPHEVGP